MLIWIAPVISCKKQFHPLKYTGGIFLKGETIYLPLHSKVKNLPSKAKIPWLQAIALKRAIKNML